MDGPLCRGRIEDRVAAIAEGDAWMTQAIEVPNEKHLA